MKSSVLRGNDKILSIFLVKSFLDNFNTQYSLILVIKTKEVPNIILVFLIGL